MDVCVRLLPMKSKSLLLPQNTETSVDNKSPREILSPSPLLVNKRPESPTKPENYLRSRKGKAGILLEIEAQEREEQKHLRQKLLSMKDELMADRHINEKFTCGCSVCMDSVGASLFNTTIDPDALLNDLSGPGLQDQDRDFNFVMKKLVPPKHVQRSLRLVVPETVSFSGGQAMYIVMTGKDRILKFVKQKDKLTLSELRKFFSTRRRRKDDNVFYAPEELDSLFLSKNVSTFSDQMSQSETPLMNNTAEGIYKASDNIYSREVALLKFKDDSTQMLGEMELMHYLLKRKVDKFWSEIHYIQKFSRPKVNFVYERDKDDPLFERAKPEILYLNGDLPRASDDFISLNEEEKFEDDLKNASVKRYCKYLLYKIVHFLEIISGVQIHIMIGDFMKDHYGLYWLLNLAKVQYKFLQVANLLGDSQIRFMDKFLPQDGNLADLKHENAERNETVKAIDEIMQQHYFAVVKKVGVDNISNIKDEDTFSDEVFAKIYPGAQLKLSQMIKGNRRYSEIQEYITKNESTLRGNDKSTSRRSKKQLNQSDIVHNASEISFENELSRKNTISKPESATISSRRARPSSVIGQRHHRPATPPKVFMQDSSIKKLSQIPQKPHTNAYFRAVKYQQGRRDSRSDNQKEYIGDKNEDMPEISIYYNQSILELNQDSYHSRKGINESKRPSVAYSGTSKVLSNIAKRAFPGIPIPSEKKHLEEAYTKGLRIPTKKRLKENFYYNLPENLPKIAHLSVLLEDPIVSNQKR